MEELKDKYQKKGMSMQFSEVSREAAVSFVESGFLPFL